MNSISSKFSFGPKETNRKFLTELIGYALLFVTVLLTLVDLDHRPFYADEAHLIVQQSINEDLSLSRRQHGALPSLLIELINDTLPFSEANFRLGFSLFWIASLLFLFLCFKNSILSWPLFFGLSAVGGLGVYFGRMVSLETFGVFFLSLILFRQIYLQKKFTYLDWVFLGLALSSSIQIQGQLILISVFFLSFFPKILLRVDRGNGLGIMLGVFLLSYWVSPFGELGIKSWLQVLTIWWGQFEWTAPGLIRIPMYFIVYELGWLIGLTILWSLIIVNKFKVSRSRNFYILLMIVIPVLFAVARLIFYNSQVEVIFGQALLVLLLPVSSFLGSRFLVKKGYKLSGFFLFMLGMSWWLHGNQKHQVAWQATYVWFWLTCFSLSSLKEFGAELSLGAQGRKALQFSICILLLFQFRQSYRLNQGSLAHSGQLINYVQLSNTARDLLKFFAKRVEPYSSDEYFVDFRLRESFLLYAGKKVEFSETPNKGMKLYIGTVEPKGEFGQSLEQCRKIEKSLGWIGGDWRAISIHRALQMAWKQVDTEKIKYYPIHVCFNRKLSLKVSKSG